MSQSLVEQVRMAGVVGAGGAGFPTHVKLGAQCEVVIANGAECEPLLQCDQQLMAELADRVIAGLALAMTATGAKQGIVAVKAKYAKAIAALEHALSRAAKSIRIHTLQDHYPAGDEHVLVYEVLGRVVPPGGLPIQVGAVVQNVHTLVHVADAAQGQPVVDRFVTVVGEVRRPQTLRLPIGTPVATAVELCGGPTCQNYAVIAGGPMMGRLIQPDEGIAKTTTGLYVLPTDHPVVLSKKTPLADSLARAKSVCEQCSFCTQYCPRYLLGHDLFPHRIMQGVGYASTVPAEATAGAFFCCECGLCSGLFACPMGLSPDRYNAELKKQLRARGLKPPHSRSALAPRSSRETRRVPVDTLIRRLALERYRRPAPMRHERVSVPKVVIPLSQGAGALAQPVVKVGQKVNTGELIADALPGSVSARVHASIAGTVTAIRAAAITIEA
ncbi:MAG: SLBB domain-containing protein [candidate division KSB1 bacterium]|nr:SLBB domain-containing protein [candidate division KSB1 bacterium]MDZ7294737.1 SLBB domain-containing protein [candidate division KSB1 bacterium]MDZ7392690.1 SLBB domain-containing protein [candidate division KSB1 bacterium]MDZ7413114.1 SLBB domain-containing protein [candidate division KSB1 bacterium]